MTCPVVELLEALHLKGYTSYKGSCPGYSPGVLSSFEISTGVLHELLQEARALGFKCFRVEGSEALGCQGLGLEVIAEVRWFT